MRARMLLSFVRVPSQDHFKDVAAILKADLDTKFPGTWHVVVGKHFGSFVTHEVRKCVIAE